MKNLHAQQRLDDLARMQRDGVDVLVIGAGITGAGVALDAAARGYSVGLIDKNDIASGTSSWSTKLAHGGIRYLPQGDVPLVHEALIERGRMLKNAPHLVRPLTFVLPLYGYSRRPVGIPVAPPGGVGLREILGIGLGMYDGLAGKYNFKRHKGISRAETLALAPCLKPEDLKSGFLYTDGQTDDSRLTLAVARTAADMGAMIATYTEVVGFDKNAGGALNAAHVRLRAPGENGKEAVISAKHIVNATGIYAEVVEQLTGEAPQLKIEPSKGVHLVLRPDVIGIGKDAIVLPETFDWIERLTCRSK